MSPTPVIATFLALLVLAAAGRDLAERRLPNRMILMALALAVGLHLLRATPQPVMLLAGAVMGFLVFLPFYLLRGMGAGDVKLMTAIGAFSGPVLVLLIAAASAIAGGVLALGYLSAPGSTTSSRMPYGPAIAIGTLAVLAYVYR